MENQTINQSEVGNLADVIAKAKRNHPKIEFEEFAGLIGQSLENKETIVGLANRVRTVLTERGAMPEDYATDEKKFLTFVQQKYMSVRKEFEEGSGMKLPPLARLPREHGRPEVKTKRRHALLDVLGKYGVKPETTTDGNNSENNAA